MPHQIKYAFGTPFDINVLLPDGTPSTIQKNLQDFIALYISTGAWAPKGNAMHALCQAPLR